jgi:hypothetical protein
MKSVTTRAGFAHPATLPRHTEGLPFLKRETFGAANTNCRRAWRALPTLLSLVPCLATARFLDSSGEEQGLVTHPIKVKHFPWENSELGREKIVIPPYEPIGITATIPWSRPRRTS